MRDESIPSDGLVVWTLSFTPLSTLSLLFAKANQDAKTKRPLMTLRCLGSVRQVRYWRSLFRCHVLLRNIAAERHPWPLFALSSGSSVINEFNSLNVFPVGVEFARISDRNLCQQSFALQRSHENWFRWYFHWPVPQKEDTVLASIVSGPEVAAAPPNYFKPKEGSDYGLLPWMLHHDVKSDSDGIVATWITLTVSTFGPSRTRMANSK